MPRRKLTPEQAVELAQRDRTIIEMRRNNIHWRDIASAVGLSMSGCHRIFETYRRQIPGSELASWREEELDLLGRGIQRLLTIAEDDRVDRNGKPIVSAHARAEAWKEIRQHSESRRKMLGVDAPTKREIEIVDTDRDAAQFNAEIAELENQLRATTLLKETE